MREFYMKKTFIIFALSGVSFLSAQQYNSDGNDSGTDSNGKYSNGSQNEHYQKTSDDRTMTSSNTQEVDDSEISKKVSDIFRGGFFSKGYDSATFEVHDGEV